MIGKVSVSLIILILLFLITPLARAETIVLSSPGTTNGLSVLIIPDGSTITSEIYSPPGGSATGLWTINFTFADGFGMSRGDTNDGDGGFITFATPVSNLTITWATSNAFIVPGPPVSIRALLPFPLPFLVQAKGLYHLMARSIPSIGSHTGPGMAESVRCLIRSPNLAVSC